MAFIFMKKALSKEAKKLFQFNKSRILWKKLFWAFMKGFIFLKFNVETCIPEKN